MKRSWQTLGDQLPQQPNRFTRALGRLFFRLSGWRLEGEIPNRSKLIIAVAPHSSNFDFVLTVGVMWALGLRASYLAKRSLFNFPLGIVMRWFGGIPVDRGTSQGLVEQMCDRFRVSSSLVLGITPEGTRAGVREWKKGFALIAHGSDVPVLPAVLNYSSKVVYFAPLVESSQDPDGIMERVQQAAAQGQPKG